LAIWIWEDIFEPRDLNEILKVVLNGWILLFPQPNHDDLNLKAIVNLLIQKTSFAVSSSAHIKLNCLNRSSLPSKKRWPHIIYLESNKVIIAFLTLGFTPYGV